MANIQKLWTSYANLGNQGNQTTGDTFIGEQGRLWYDPVTNTIRASDGSTPGGTIVNGGNGGGNTSPGAPNNSVQFNSNGNFAGDANFTFNSSTNTLTVDNINANITSNTFVSNSANLGNFTINDQTLSGTVSDRDVTIAAVGAGNIEILGGFHVHTDGNSANLPQFVAANGRVEMLVPTPNSYTGAVNIIGSPSGTEVAPQNPGVVLHSTGQQSVPSRIYNDGVANYGVVINRRYNGTSDAPTGVLANQIVGRVGATPYLLNSTWPTISTTRLDFISTQDQTAANQGSQIQLWATANNSNAPQIVAQFDPSLVLFTGNLVPNSTTSQFSLGNATNKWGNLYLGPDSLFIEDSTLGTNAELTVDNGVLLINGTQRVQIGNMQMTTSGIQKIAGASSEDLTIGTTGGGNTFIRNAGIKFNDNTIQSTAAIPLTQRGNAGGVATLGLDGIVPASQLPAGGVSYQGTWNASTNTPTLADGTGTAGQEYIVSTGGTQTFGGTPITFNIGDGILYNGSIWQRVPGVGSGVTSFNTRTGAVTLTSGDVTNALSSGSITNAKLANSNIVVTTGFGLGGGATVDLGGTLSLTANVGNILGGTGVNVVSSSGNYTVSIGQPVGTGNSVQFLAVSANTTIQATGNVTGGNLTTAGKVVASGNIETSAYLKTSNTTINSSLTSNGIINFTSSPNVSLGSNANIHISGGSTGQLLSTDGSGNLKWISSGNIAPTSGTWTPTLVPDSGSYTLTINNTYYQKIGGMAFCTFDITIASQSGTSGNVIMGNLPFTSASTSATTGSLSISFYTAMNAATNVIAGTVPGSATTVTMYWQGSYDTKMDPLTANKLKATTRLVGTIYYATSA